MKDWTRYYDAIGDEPRDTLLAALDRFETPGPAVDLGCGTGRDTIELLRRGWRVVAIAADRFDDLWMRIGDALRQGGRFCGQLFGDRDGWAPDPGITCLTRFDVDSLSRAYEIERLDEVEEDSTTAVGDAKHWHVFHVVARRR